MDYTAVALVAAMTFMFQQQSLHASMVQQFWASQRRRRRQTLTMEQMVSHLHLAEEQSQAF